METVKIKIKRNILFNYYFTAIASCKGSRMDLKKREEILNYLLAAGVDVTSDMIIFYNIL